MNGLIQLLNSIGISGSYLAQAVFYFLAASTCFFALRIVISRNVFHSAMFLALTLIGVACIYLYLGSEFLAVMQVLIYVGAIVALFVFVIMLTTNVSDRAIKPVNPQVLISAIVVLVLFCLLVAIISSYPWQKGLSEQAELLNLTDLSKSLALDYVLPFEVVALILLAALIGAIAIGKVKKE